jgi:hypothetical protein
MVRYVLADDRTHYYAILHLNDINVKNQGVHMYSKTIAKGKVSLFLNRFLLGLTIISFLWGCAGKSDTVLIKDTSQTVKPDTIISTKTGKSITFDQLMADLNRYQIIFVRSYQEVVDLWSAGVLDEETFLRKVHWYANWQFDFGLYRDILGFIKENRIKIVALNIPFYITGRIRVGGIDNLPDTDKQYLPKEIDTSNAASNSMIFIWYSAYGMKSWRSRLRLILAETRSLFWPVTAIFSTNTVYRIVPFVARTHHFEPYTWFRRERRLSWV